MRAPGGAAWAALVALLLPAASFGAGDDMCATNSANVEIIANLREPPGYFARVTPDGKQVGFTLDGEDHVHNFADSAGSVTIPGQSDAVPSADGRFILVPRPLGMTFYLRSDIDQHHQPGRPAVASEFRVDKEYLPPKMEDGSLDSNYQSSGVLSRSGASDVLRVETSGMNYRDYNVDPEGNVSPAGPVRKLCGNLGQGKDDQLRLPMISKDGAMESAFDPQTNTTKIYRIDGENCEELLDLGLPTGKVDFSYAGDQVTFHTDSLDDSDVGQFFEAQRPRMVKNVYVAKLGKSDDGRLQVTGIRRVTNNTQAGEGSYYPSFTQDGRIAYLQDDQGNYSIRLLNPVNAQERTLAPEACDPAGIDPTLPALALGALWQQICPKIPKDLKAPDATLWSLSLTPTACVKLVQEKWDALKDKVLAGLAAGPKATPEALRQLGAGSLVAACPKGGAPASGSPVIQPVVTSPRDLKPVSAEKTFRNRCATCHDTRSNAAPHIDWDQLSEPLMQEMMLRVQSTDPDIHMPPNIPLDQKTEVEPFVDYLKNPPPRDDS